MTTINPNLRHHERSCINCRFYRLTIQRYNRDDPRRITASCGDCLLLGRTLSIADGRTHLHSSWNGCKICDLWAKRPKAWREWVERNPYWYDPYMGRLFLLRRRLKLRVINRHKYIEELFNAYREMLRHPMHYTDAERAEFRRAIMACKQWRIEVAVYPTEWEGKPGFSRMRTESLWQQQLRYMLRGVPVTRKIWRDRGERKPLP